MLNFAVQWMYHHTTDLQIPIIRPYIACSLICLLVWKISSLPPKIACFKLYIYVRISYILTCNQFLPVREKKFPSGVEDAPIFSSTFLPFFPITTTYTCNKQPHHKRFHHFLLVFEKHREPLISLWHWNLPYILWLQQPPDPLTLKQTQYP